MPTDKANRPALSELAKVTNQLLKGEIIALSAAKAGHGGRRPDPAHHQPRQSSLGHSKGLGHDQEKAA